jgi:hypothetical protein
MERSESIKELAIALAKAQTAIKPAIKDSENPHFRSKYADLSSIWDACRKPLTDNGLSVMQMPVDAGDGRVALTTMVIHASGEFISSTVSTKLQKDDAQGVGSALTYLRRYALASAIGVVADDDDDGAAASKPVGGSATYTARPTGAASSAGKASDKQIKMLFAIWNKGGYEGSLKEWIKENYQCEIDGLGMKDASDAIETLQKTAEAAPDF